MSSVKPVVLVYCREGFEAEAGQELARTIGGLLGLRRTPVASYKANAAFAWVPLTHPAELVSLRRKLNFRDLVFARQLAFGFGPIDLGDVRDRASPLAEILPGSILETIGSDFSRMTVTYPDNNDGKELTRFAKLIHPPLVKSFSQSGATWAQPAGRGLPVLNVFFFDRAKSAFVTWIDATNSSPWPGGVPRLKFPPSAPSRSTLKLEEAFHVFMDKSAQDSLLKPGLRIVDLGASPGGWTWQFVHREMFVTAVDNGMMASSLLETGMVDHIKEDAFKFRPRTPVDWMVCDVVEQPSRVAKLASQWIESNLCKHLIVNLKLPMKQRLEEVDKCLEIIGNSNKNWTLQAKQLYHDRREVTVFATSNFGTT